MARPFFSLHRTEWREQRPPVITCSRSTIFENWLSFWDNKYHMRNSERLLLTMMCSGKELLQISRNSLSYQWSGTYFSSLIPRPIQKLEKTAWYPLFTHALNFPIIPCHFHVLLCCYMCWQLLFACTSWNWAFCMPSCEFEAKRGPSKLWKSYCEAFILGKSDCTWVVIHVTKL